MGIQALGISAVVPNQWVLSQRGAAEGGQVKDHRCRLSVVGDL